VVLLVCLLSSIAMYHVLYHKSATEVFPILTDFSYVMDNLFDGWVNMSGFSLSTFWSPRSLLIIYVFFGVYSSFMQAVETLFSLDILLSVTCRLLSKDWWLIKTQPV